MKRSPLDGETYTARVLATLVEADDFMTMQQINKRLSDVGSSRVSAALHHLYKHHAVDCIEQDNFLWWFATVEEDRRSVVRRRHVELRGRKRRPMPHPRRRANEKPKRD